VHAPPAGATSILASDTAPLVQVGRGILAKEVGRRGTAVPVICPPRKRGPRAGAGPAAVAGRGQPGGAPPFPSARCGAGAGRLPPQRCRLGPPARACQGSVTFATRGGYRSAGLVLAWGATGTGATPALP